MSSGVDQGLAQDTSITSPSEVDDRSATCEAEGGFWDADARRCQAGGSDASATDLSTGLVADAADSGPDGQTDGDAEPDSDAHDMIDAPGEFGGGS